MSKDDFQKIEYPDETVYQGMTSMEAIMMAMVLFDENPDRDISVFTADGKGQIKVKKKKEL